MHKFLRASAIARSESIDDIWLLLLSSFFFLARFVKYSNIKADMACLMEYKVVRYENLRFFSMSAVCLLSADCLLFAKFADMDSMIQCKVIR